MRELNGKVAVITGGASGIGRALAERAASLGMHVVIADIEEEPLRVTEKSLAEGGADVLGVPTDVSDASSVQALADATVKKFGTAHLVCNNAGVAGTGDLSWVMPPSTWEWMFAVNVWGVINGLRAFVPILVEQDEGHVVNTTSISGLLGGLGSAPYTSSKYAVVGMTESLRAELATSGSRVKTSVLCPGRIETNITHADRNWPERLGPKPKPRDTDKLGVHEVPEVMRAMFDTPMSPGVVAELVLDAVAAERFWVITHPAEVKAMLELKMNDIFG